MKSQRALILVTLAALGVGACDGGVNPVAAGEIPDLQARYSGLGWEGSGHKLSSDSSNTSGSDSTTAQGEDGGSTITTLSGLGWNGSGH